MLSWRCTLNAPHSGKCTLFWAFSRNFLFPQVPYFQRLAENVITYLFRPSRCPGYR
jgi:hypothetical protein